jgi:CRP/FNR family transcriptional regulator, cyclic AMP receptor protein
MEWELLAGLSDAARRDVLASSRRRRFARNEIVFHEGDAGDSLHLLDRGAVAVRVSTPLGDVATLTVLGPGQFFGEGALLAPDARRTATIVALAKVETLVLDRSRFDELRRDHRDVDEVVVGALAAQVRRLSAHLLEALFVPVERRLFRRLLALTEVFGDEIPLRQDDLASMAGTTRPTANRLLREAEDAGDISLARGQITVIDRHSLDRRGR